MIEKVSWQRDWKGLWKKITTSNIYLEELLRNEEEQRTERDIKKIKYQLWLWKQKAKD